MNTTEVERWSPFRAWLYSLLYRCPRSNKATIDLLDLGPGDSLLDIGCGPGAALELAASRGASVAGVDPSPSMATRAANRVPAAHVEVGSAEAIPFASDRFNVVINIASFHHWADRDAGLRESLRVLAPGGGLHIVEAALKDDKDGHGLDPREVELVMARLSEIGYTDVASQQMKPGWFQVFTVISAIAP